jgi:hypothetical protein
LNVLLDASTHVLVQTQEASWPHVALDMHVALEAGGAMRKRHDGMLLVTMYPDAKKTIADITGR